MFFSAGPKMAGSILPAIVNLLDADGAVSPAKAEAPAEDPGKRVDSVTALALTGNASGAQAQCRVYGPVRLA